MVNSIIQSISSSLNKVFDCAVYMEEEEPDMTKPYFYIKCENSSSELIHGKGYKRENQFCIKYIPSAVKKQEECNQVAEKLFWCLECIEMEESFLRAAKMKYEVVEGMLLFSLNYNTVVCRVEEMVPMETMKTNLTMKG